MNDLSSGDISATDNISASNEEIFDHPYSPILLTALMLLLLFITTAFIAYQTTSPQEAAMIEMPIEDQPVPTSTLQLNDQDDQEDVSDLFTYTDNDAGFLIKHPNFWKTTIMDPTETSTDNYFGSIELTDGKNKIILLFGGRLGSAPCGEDDSAYSEGELISIESRAGTIFLCKISSADTILFEGGCGNCGILKEETGYSFKAETNQADLEQVLDIISTFEFID